MVIKKRIVVKKEPTLKIPKGWKEIKTKYHENAYYKSLLGVETTVTVGKLVSQIGNHISYRARFGSALSSLASLEKNRLNKPNFDAKTKQEALNKIFSAVKKWETLHKPYYN